MNFSTSRANLNFNYVAAVSEARDQPSEENELFSGLRAAIKNNRNELLFQFHEYLKINDLDIFCRSQKLMNMQLVREQLTE